MAKYQIDPACNGTGYIGDILHELCEGTGRLPIKAQCPTCEGDTVLLDLETGIWSMCPTCFGQGYLPIEAGSAFSLQAIADNKDAIADSLNKLNDVKQKVDEIKTVVDEIKALL